MKGDTMRHDYNTNQAADYMAVGFDYMGKLYYHKRRVSYFLEMFKYDFTSKSHGRIACLRFKPTAAQKKQMITDHAVMISSDTELFFQRRKQQNENRGQIWEKYLIEEFGGVPCVNRYWWNGGDYMVGGNIIQVKFENATVCTAKQCRMHR